MHLAQAARNYQIRRVSLCYTQNEIHDEDHWLGRLYLDQHVENCIVVENDPAYFNQAEWESRQIFGQNTGIRQVFQLKNSLFAKTGVQP